MLHDPMFRDTATNRPQALTPDSTRLWGLLRDDQMRKDSACLGALSGKHVDHHPRQFGA